MFVNEAGDPDPISAEDVAQTLLGRPGIRAMVLSACRSGERGAGSLYHGVGPALVQKRVPCVVAMQYPSVLNSTAGEFCRVFYRELKAGKPVDIAVNLARQALSVLSLADRDWSTPVIFLGARSYRILDDEKVTARLGQGLQATGAIAPETMERAAEAIARMASIARGMGVERLRDPMAGNGRSLKHGCQQDRARRPLAV